MKTKIKSRQKKEFPSMSFLSVSYFPYLDSFPINDRECKIMIDEEQSCHKYLVKIGLRNFLKSISGIVILKNMPKMVKDI